MLPPNRDLSDIKNWLPTKGDSKARPVVYATIVSISVESSQQSAFSNLSEEQRKILETQVREDLDTWLPRAAPFPTPEESEDNTSFWMVKNQGDPDNENPAFIKQEGKGRWESSLSDVMKKLKMILKQSEKNTTQYFLEDDSPDEYDIDGWQITNWRLDFKPAPELMDMDLFCDTVTWQKEFSIPGQKFTFIALTAHGWEPYDK